MTALSHDDNSAPGTAAVPYATPAPRSPSRGWAGPAILLGGLVLVLLGGCFLIGVLIIVGRFDFTGKTTGQPLSAGETSLLWVLYLLAFASFAGAVVMLAAGTRGLLRVVRG